MIKRLKSAAKSAGWHMGFALGWLYWWLVPALSWFAPLDDAVTCIPGAFEGEIRAYHCWRDHIAR